MKLLILSVLIITLFSCNQETEKSKDYATLSGKITDKNSDSLQILNRTFTKTIKVNADGTFKDTLKVESGVYILSDGKENTPILLKNGYDIKVTLDTKQFDETISYSGEGSEHSNYLAQHALLQEELFADMDDINEANLDSTFESIQMRLSEFYDSNKGIDTMIINGMKNDLEPMLNSYKGYFGQKIALKKEFPEGAPSPTFDYENFQGGKTSLKDLKGKYVYLDIWATWCGPCIMEIPALKNLEAQYNDKNIEFVSISIDQQKDYETWKKMIVEKELGGIQLFADNNWNSEFVKNYKINGIPRFILIDPNGNVVSPDAPRPSDPKLVELFDELKI